MLNVSNAEYDVQDIGRHTAQFLFQIKTFSHKSSLQTRAPEPRPQEPGRPLPVNQIPYHETQICIYGTLENVPGFLIV